MTPERSLGAWVPDRGDVIWIDPNPHPIGRLDADKLEQVRSIVGRILGFLP